MWKFLKRSPASVSSGIFITLSAPHTRPTEKWKDKKGFGQMNKLQKKFVKTAFNCACSFMLLLGWKLYGDLSFILGCFIVCAV